MSEPTTEESSFVFKSSGETGGHTDVAMINEEEFCRLCEVDMSFGSHSGNPGMT